MNMTRRGFLAGMAAAGAVAATATSAVAVGLRRIIGRPVAVPMDFNTTGLTMSIDEFAERILEPAMRTLADGIETGPHDRYEGKGRAA